jgi:pre-mRNA-splicing helicase BRR2
MANLGGGAEAHARLKQYEYRANSSLVLTADSRPRDTHESTGEPETLWGRIDKKNFGDRAVQAKPPELEERLTKSRKKKERDTGGEADLPRKRRRREESVLSLADDVIYKPQTKETRAAYEAMLSVIQRQFGGQPMDVLGGPPTRSSPSSRTTRSRTPTRRRRSTSSSTPYPPTCSSSLSPSGSSSRISMTPTIRPPRSLLTVLTRPWMMLLELLSSSKRTRRVILIRC